MVMWRMNGKKEKNKSSPFFIVNVGSKELPILKYKQKLKEKPV